MEAQVDGGRGSVPPSTTHGAHAWRLWSLTVDDLAPGRHTLVSRATDAEGHVQPTQAERRAFLASGREDNSQWLRTIEVG
ncbi:MAG: hypothetical protein R2712_16385 [Vicinamibacterales bacterium]